MTSDIEKDELKNLGIRLRGFRQSRNYSQEKFAELTKLDRTYISGLERGLRNPSYLIIKRISEVLEINVNQIFSGE